MNPETKKNAIIYGILWGVISIIITTLQYSIDIQLFAAKWISFIKIVIFFTLACLLLSSAKKAMKGITFKQAFTIFVIFVTIGFGLATIFEILLFNFIDPSIKEPLKQLSIDEAVKGMRMFGAPESAIDKSLVDLRNQDQYSIASQLKGFVIILLISFIPGLILSAIFKSKTPNSI